MSKVYKEMVELKEGEPERLKLLKIEVQKALLKFSTVYEELTFQEILAKIGYTSPQKLGEIREIIEHLLFEGKLNARIRGNSLVFGKQFERKTVEILTDIKDDTELIKEYTSLLEDVFNKTDDIEIYLKEHLATDYEKIKDKIDDYKQGKIKRKELIKNIIKTLGKNIGKILIRKV